MLGYFMRRLVAAEKEAGTKNVVAITDSIPNKKKRNSIEKEIKGAVGRRQLPGIQYGLIHHESRSHFGLQIADYCCWAIQRKWKKGQLGWYHSIKPAIRHEFDVFQHGTEYYY